MNIVKSTANKVMELEKRLDNELAQEGFRVSEVKRDFGVISMPELAEYEILTFTGGNEAKNIVLQGEIRVRVNSACNIRTTLILDGYEIYTRVATYEVGVYTISVLKTVNIAPKTSQKLVLRLERLGGGASELATYNFFIWGYGESASFSEDLPEPKLSGATDGTKYAIFLISGSVGYVNYSDAFPEGLDAGALTEFGAISGIAPVYRDSVLYLFTISPSGDLALFFGEDASPDFETASVIDSGVSSVSATVESETNTIVVVYSKGGEVYYFTYDGETRSESQLIYAFTEKILDVSLIQNCESTTFLAVGLESGKNYLFSSVTAVTASTKSSKILAGMSVAFE